MNVKVDLWKSMKVTSRDGESVDVVLRHSRAGAVGGSHFDDVGHARPQANHYEDIPGLHVVPN